MAMVRMFTPWKLAIIKIRAFWVLFFAELVVDQLLSHTPLAGRNLACSNERKSVCLGWVQVEDGPRWGWGNGQGTLTWGLVSHFEGSILILCTMGGHWRILNKRMSLDFAFWSDSNVENGLEEYNNGVGEVAERTTSKLLQWSRQEKSKWLENKLAAGCKKEGRVQDDSKFGHKCMPTLTKLNLGEDEDYFPRNRRSWDQNFNVCVCECVC